MEIYSHQFAYLSLIKELHVKFPGLQELINLVKGTGIYYFTDTTFKSTGIRNVLHKQKGRTHGFHMGTWDELLEVVGFKC